MIRWIAMSTAVALLAISVAACNKHAIESSRTGATTPAPTAATTASSSAAPVAAGPAAATGAAATLPAVTTSAGLAQVSADLSGITVGVSQANTDVGAGDSERTKSDDPN